MQQDVEQERQGASWLNRLSTWLIVAFAKIILKICYRIKTNGRIDIPPGKGCLIIANHVSFVDFLMVTFILPKGRVGYAVMDHEIFQLPLVNTICKAVGAIPIAPKKDSLEIREAAFARIHDLLSAGEYLLFFPEGVVTHDGRISGFRHGLERIRNENPGIFIVPVTIEGLVGGFFSRVGGLFNPKKIFREFGRRVSITMAPPIPATRWQMKHFEVKVRIMLGESMETTDCGEGVISLPAVRSRNRHTPKRRKTGTVRITSELVPIPVDSDIVLLDFSEQGLCVESNMPFGEASSVHVVLDGSGLDLSGIVRWCKKNDQNLYRVGIQIIDYDKSLIFIDEPHQPLIG